MLAGGFDRKVEACNYPFDDKMIILNNAEYPDRIIDQLEELTENATYAQDLKHAIARDFKVHDPNVYALSELVAIWIARSDPETDWHDYLVYVQGDCITQGDWIKKGIKILEENPDVSVVSPASEVNTWHDPVTKKDHYMSDQAWLVRVEEFRNPEVYQYSLKMPQDPDYPDYGGNSFEHMVGQYLKATGKYRYIVEDAWTIHGTV